VTRPGEALGRAAAEWIVTRRVEVNGLSVRYREAGSGPALVLVHGLGCSADYWVRNGPPLAAAGLRVLAPDLPGFGRTEGPWRGLDIDEQATALADWFDAWGSPPPCAWATPSAARRWWTWLPTTRGAPWPSSSPPPRATAARSGASAR
jgi:alpha-beta hydrolase superfamily lysophospholipase